MNINQLTWTPLFLSRAISHWTLTRQFLKRPKCALLKSSDDVMSVFTFFPSSQELHLLIVAAAKTALSIHMLS